MQLLTSNIEIHVYADLMHNSSFDPLTGHSFKSGTQRSVRVPPPQKGLILYIIIIIIILSDLCTRQFFFFVSACCSSFLFFLCS